MDYKLSSLNLKGVGGGGIVRPNIKPWDQHQKILFADDTLKRIVSMQFIATKLNIFT